MSKFWLSDLLCYTSDLYPGGGGGGGGGGGN